MRRIREIERLGADLEAEPLVQPEVAEHAQIQVVVAGAAQLIEARGSEKRPRDRRIGCCVDVRLSIKAAAVYTGTTGVNQVRRLRVAGTIAGSGASRDCEGNPGIMIKDSIQAPAAEDRRLQAMICHGLIFTKRQIICPA